MFFMLTVAVVLLWCWVNPVNIAEIMS